MMTSANLVFQDGNYNSPVAVSAPVFSSPLPGVSTQLMVTQEFCCWNGSFVPTPLNTLHPDNTQWLASGVAASSFYLTAEGPRQDIGGGLVKWTRTYCQQPSRVLGGPRYDGSSYSYQFPGIDVLTGIGTTVATQRTPLTKPAPCKVQYDYYLVGPGAGATGAGSDGVILDYATFDLIPAIQHTRYTTNITNGGLVIGLTDTLILTPSAGNGQATEPTSQQYQGIADNSSATSVIPTPYTNSRASGPDNTTFLGGLWPIVVQDSEISRWQGNIYQRVTKYVQAL
jgi:hypothetical protein